MKVPAFEKEFAARMNTRFALAVSSGTAALEAAMAALQVSANCTSAELWP